MLTILIIGLLVGFGSILLVGYSYYKELVRVQAALKEARKELNLYHVYVLSPNTVRSLQGPTNLNRLLHFTLQSLPGWAVEGYEEEEKEASVVVRSEQILHPCRTLRTQRGALKATKEQLAVYQTKTLDPGSKLAKSLREPIPFDELLGEIFYEEYRHSEEFLREVREAETPPEG